MKYLPRAMAPAALASMLLLSPVVSRADLLCDAETVFNWAETVYPQYFNTRTPSQSLDPWRYRYYPATGIYVGVQSDRNVYVQGGSFGNTPVYAGPLAQLYAGAKLAGASGGLYCGNLACQTETVFNWAEIAYPQYFGSAAQSQIAPPWRLREYPATGMSVAVNEAGGVYVWGGEYGSTPVPVGEIGTFYNAAKDAGVSGGLACGVTFTNVQLPAAQSGNLPPNGSYLGLTYSLNFVDKDLVFGEANTNFNDGGNLLRSDDGGVNWTRPLTLVAPIQAVAFADKSVGYVVGSRASFGVSQYLGKSVDGGKTWSDITANLAQVNEVVANIPRYTLIYNVAAPLVDTLFIAGRHTLYESSDGGNSWKLAAGAKSRDENTPTSLYWTSLTTVSGRVFIASYTALESVDLGTGSTGEWVKRLAPWNQGDGLPLVNLAFERSTSGWAVIERTSAGLLELYETTNGGVSWTKVSQAGKSDTTAVFPNSGNLVAFGNMLFGTAKLARGNTTNDYVVVSSDGGRTWEKSDYYGIGWPLFLKVVDNELRAYLNVHGDYNLRAYTLVRR